jgi:hypothetical protein
MIESQQHLTPEVLFMSLDIMFIVLVAGILIGLGLKRLKPESVPT